MQGNAEVVKFKKKPKKLVGDNAWEEGQQLSGKRNKVRRGGKVVWEAI